MVRVERMYDDGTARVVIADAVVLDIRWKKNAINQPVFIYLPEYVMCSRETLLEIKNQIDHIYHTQSLYVRKPYPAKRNRVKRI